MADDRFVNDTFHGGPTGPQPDERWTQPIDPNAVRIHMEVVMSDDKTTEDHAQAIRHEIDILSDNGIFGLAKLERHTDALIAERDRVIAYARELESIVEAAQRDNRMIDDVVDLRVEHGVADIMAGDREGTA